MPRLKNRFLVCIDGRLYPHQTPAPGCWCMAIDIPNAVPFLAPPLATVNPKFVFPPPRDPPHWSLRKIPASPTPSPSPSPSPSPPSPAAPSPVPAPASVPHPVSPPCEPVTASPPQSPSEETASEPDSDDDPRYYPTVEIVYYTYGGGKYKPGHLPARFPVQVPPSTPECASHVVSRQSDGAASAPPCASPASSTSTLTVLSSSPSVYQSDAPCEPSPPPVRQRRRAVRAPAKPPVRRPTSPLTPDPRSPRAHTIGLAVTYGDADYDEVDESLLTVLPDADEHISIQSGKPSPAVKVPLADSQPCSKRKRPPTPVTLDDLFTTPPPTKPTSSKAAAGARSSTNPSESHDALAKSLFPTPPRETANAVAGPGPSTERSRSRGSELLPSPILRVNVSSSPARARKHPRRTDKENLRPEGRERKRARHPAPDPAPSPVKATAEEIYQMERARLGLRVITAAQRDVTRKQALASLPHDNVDPARHR